MTLIFSKRCCHSFITKCFSITPRILRFIVLAVVLLGIKGCYHVAPCPLLNTGSSCYDAANVLTGLEANRPRTVQCWTTEYNEIPVVSDVSNARAAFIFTAKLTEPEDEDAFLRNVGNCLTVETS
jgi:hypothetical protein